MKKQPVGGGESVTAGGATQRTTQESGVSETPEQAASNQRLANRLLQIADQGGGQPTSGSSALQTFLGGVQPANLPGPDLGKAGQAPGITQANVYQPSEIQAMLNQIRGQGYQQQGTSEISQLAGMAARGFAPGGAATQAMGQATAMGTQGDIASKSAQALTGVAQQEAQTKLGQQQAGVGAWTQQQKAMQERGNLGLQQYGQSNRAILDAWNSAARMASAFGRASDTSRQQGRQAQAGEILAQMYRPQQQTTQRTEFGNTYR
jgi:hypothetical protein